MELTVKLSLCAYQFYVTISNRVCYDFQLSGRPAQPGNSINAGFSWYLVWKRSLNFEVVSVYQPRDAVCCRSTALNQLPGKLFSLRILESFRR